MKKIIYLLGILIIITAFSFSQSLTITSPSRAVSWELGSSHLIQWTYSGAGNIMIQLYQSGSPAGTIYNGANSGSFDWRIDHYLNSNPIATGSYRLRVRSKLNSSVYDEVDLTITDAGGTPGGETLTITRPSSSSVSWELNSRHLIQWTYGGSGDIMIQLYQSGSPAGTVYNGANSGSFDWRIDRYLNGNPIATGNYKLRVRSKVDSSKYDEVDLTINSGSEETPGEENLTTTAPIGTMMYELKPHSIKVLSFQHYESFKIDSTIRIRWEAKNLTHPIRILLIRRSEGNLHSWVIKDSLNPDIGYYDWKPRDTKGILPFPDYYIKIEEIGTGIYGVSNAPIGLTNIHVDLSIRLTNERVPYLATDHGTAVILSFRVRDNDPRHGILRNVPVRVRVEDQVQTKYIRRIQFDRRHYEYTVDFTFRLYDRHRSHTVNNTFRVIASVDPQDIYHDDNRLNNTIRFNIIF